MYTASLAWSVVVRTRVGAVHLTGGSACYLKQRYCFSQSTQAVVPSAFLQFSPRFCLYQSWAAAWLWCPQAHSTRTIPMASADLVSYAKGVPAPTASLQFARAAVGKASHKRRARSLRLSGLCHLQPHHLHPGYQHAFCIAWLLTVFS